MRAALKAALVALLCASCVRSIDAREEIRARDEAIRALSERIAFDNAERMDGTIEGGAGPGFASFLFAPEIGEDIPLEIRVATWTGAEPATLLFEIDRSNEVQRVTLANEDGLRTARATIAPSMLPADRRQVARLALVDAAGEVGPITTVPINVLDADELPGAQITVLAGSRVPIEAVDLRDQTVVTGAVDGTLDIWNDTRFVREIRAHLGSIHEIRIRDDRVFSAGADGFVRAHDLGSGERVWEMEVHGDVARAMALSPTDAILASGGWDQQLVTLDPSTGAEDERTDLGDRINDLAYSSDGQLLAVALGRLALPGRALVLRAETGDVVQDIEVPQDVTAIAVSPSGALAMAFGRSEIQIRTGEETISVVGAPPDTVEDLVFVSGDTLMGLSLNGEITIWKLEGQPVFKERFEEEAFALRADDERAVFGTAQGTVWVVPLMAVQFE
ncbi:MAG: hypothetical protein AAGE52_07240 [Myxococcota bacterium]